MAKTKAGKPKRRKASKRSTSSRKRKTSGNLPDGETVDAVGVRRDKKGKFARGTARPPNSGWKTDSRAGFRDLIGQFGILASELAAGGAAIDHLRDQWNNGGRLGRLEVLKFLQRFLLRAMDRIPAGVDPALDIGFGPARDVGPAGVDPPKATEGGT